MAVPSTVELIVKVANAVNPLRQVEKQANKTSEAIRKSALGFEAVSKASLKVKEQVEATQGGFAKASKVVGTFSAKVLNTEKAMRAQIRALREVQSTVKFNGAVYKKAGAEIARYEAILKSANTTTEKAKRANNGFADGLRKLAIGFGAARAAQAALQAGIRRDESERRLRLLTERFGETAQAQEAAQRAADKFNLSQTEANVQLSRLIARLRPMGLSMATIETAFAGFNTATILAGATASESAGAFLQLSQALGSGVLRGQELNSILEQAPLIAQAIATEMNVAVGALKKLGEDGKITSDIVIRALGRVEREGAGQLEKALKGPAAAIKAFQNATEDVQVALTQDIIPEMAKSFRELADLIRSLGPLFRGVGADIGGGLGAINDLIDINRMSKTESARSILERGRLAPGERGLPELFEPLGGKEFIDRLRAQAANAAKETGKNVVDLYVANLQRALKTLDARASTLPSNFDMMVMNAGGPKAKPVGLTDEEKKRLEKIELQNVAAKTRLFQSQEELAILQETNNVEKIKLQFASKRAKVQRNFVTLFSKSLSEQERGNLVAALRGELDKLTLEQNQAITNEIRSQFDAAMKFNGQLVELIPETNKLSEEFKSMADTINNEIINGIQGMIEGTKTLGQVASSMLRKIANQMLETAIMGQKGSGGIGGMLLSAVGSFFGAGASTAGPGGFTIGEAATPMTSGLDFSSAFAKGGRPPVGKAALVGERGPELFVPSRAGTIVPNHELGGSTSVVVNVDASGTEVQGNQGNADQLGRLIGQAVQAELIKQKRPGGLLTR